ncbi:hypothetical protein BVX97_04125 [bacterium E08(2017)]|nr:hypothetical protein BVX97_04125 [bacterium E08(2017)]
MSAVEGRFKHLALPIDEFARFNSQVLGLGDISKEGVHMNGLAAIFDLEGFTSFCSQPDPQLYVPQYLDDMLKWLFKRVSENFRKETVEEEVVLWGKFPFFAKFMGDGILFIWDTTGLGPASLGNIIINIYKTSVAYEREFLPEVSKKYSKIPKRMRCGIARGQVFAIGEGKDFIGSCINQASRLQKISHLSFAFAQKGFDIEDCFSKTWQNEFLLKRIPVRGFHEDVLICILKREFDQLSEEEQGHFKEP